MSQFKRNFLMVAALLAAMSASVAHAERPDHFKGIAAETAEEAYLHLAEYNQKLETLLQGELTAEAMAEIHQITYTLENALQRLDDELEDVAESLEELHLASERNNTTVALEKGKDYLKKAGKFSAR